MAKNGEINKNQLDLLKLIGPTSKILSIAQASFLKDLPTDPVKLGACTPGLRNWPRLGLPETYDSLAWCKFIICSISFGVRPRPKWLAYC